MGNKNTTDRAERAILGCGWLGLPLASRWASQGKRVNGATTSPDKVAVLAEKGIRPHLVRMEATELPDSQPFFDADLLVLCIPPGRSADAYPQLIRQAGQAARRQGCKKVIFTSSTGVYGRSQGWVNEDSARTPDSASALALEQAEDHLRDIFADDLTILRLAGLAGPGRLPGRWLAGKQAVPNGLDPVNLVHLDDVIGVIEAVIAQEAWGRCFNVCADLHPLRQDYYPRAALALNMSPPVFSASEETGGNSKIIDNSRVKDTLHYVFQYPDPDRFVY